MYDYRQSWTFWLFLIFIVILILVIFAKSNKSEHYEITENNTIKAKFDNITAENNQNKIQYRIIDDIEEYNEEEYGDEEYGDESINLEPELPIEFLSEVSVGDPSMIKRTKPEKICRKTVEKIYGKKFSRVHPEWLRNPESGRKLELDCYNDELKIAVEYNGPQHYIWPNHFPMTREKFLAQNRRDNFKIDACDKNGVYLITVPYNVPYDLIPDYINYYLPHNVERRKQFGIEE